MLISVVVPVYNSEETIGKCIESILVQTFSDIELILVDDGSTDKSGEICDDYARKDCRIIVVHQANKGRTEARRQGVERCSGSWITFVDSDDTLPQDAISSLYEQAGDDTDIVLGNGYELSGEHRELISMSEFRHLAVRAEGIIGVPWGSLYRKSVVTPYLFDLPRDIVVGEDYIFWLRLVFSTEKPVRVVYKNVYEKGADHTSNCFQWTAEYARRVDELRVSAIPADVRHLYAEDVSHDRLGNMLFVAICQPKREWKNSEFYQDVKHDMETLGVSLKQRLFFQLPGRWLRKRYTKAHLLDYFFLLVTAIAILALYLLDEPTLSDDMIYRFMWNTDESAPVQSIQNLGDLLHSQWIHYLSVNGRWVVHLLAQAFLVFVPPVVLQVVNAVLFVLLLHLCGCWLTGDVSQRLTVHVSVFFLLFVVFQGFRTAFLWGLGAFNYLWVLVVVMGLLLWLRHIERRPLTLLHVLLAPLAFFVGAGHEALSLPVSAAFLVYIILHRNGLARKSILLYMLWFMVGTASVLLSPGIWSRSAEGISLQSRMLSGIINMVFNLRVLWLLALMQLVLWKKKRRIFLNNHYKEHVYEYVALLLSVMIVVLCGTNLERVAFFTDFIAMLLLLDILLKTMAARWLKAWMIMASVILLISYVPAYMVRKENSQNWQYAIRQMEQPGRELIAVRYPIKGCQPVLDYFRARYINPSIEFGFYCSYMAFDSNDINMRCAAQLYGKERLTFLPEDVVERIAADSTAYKDCELDEHQSLYVWQLPADRSKVSRLTFLLKEEDVSSLLPHQRLLTYKEDIYDLDDFHFEVVQVGRRPYLVFTRPTTNISRRISEIEYLPVRE